MPMILAIGIYQDTLSEGPDRFKKINSAPQENANSFFKANLLAKLEKSMIELDMPLDTHGYELKVDNEYHYVLQAANNVVFAFVSRAKLDNTEAKYLFKNINHIHVSPTLVKMTLDDIIANPLGFTGHEINLGKIQSDVDETKIIMRKNVDELLGRGDTLESLEKKSVDLAEKSKKFREDTENLNRCRC